MQWRNEDIKKLSVLYIVIYGLFITFIYISVACKYFTNHIFGAKGLIKLIIPNCITAAPPGLLCQVVSDYAILFTRIHHVSKI